MNHWQQLDLICVGTEADFLSDALMERGALSVSLAPAKQEEFLFELMPGTQPLWQIIQLTALFEDSFIPESLAFSLQEYQAKGLLQSFTWSELQDQNWHAAWLDNYEPIAISQNLWICPSWKTPTDPNAINIFLDPGLAFGTGTHPTTAMCLRWLERHIKGGETLIDFGCGSGILAIAAVKLGCRKVLATDIDHQALTVTRENAQKNGIDESILETVLAPIDSLPTADLVVANILATPLIELAPTITRLLKPTGQLALSGLLSQQAIEVCAAYQDQSVSLKIAEEIDNWICLGSRI